MEIKIKLLDEKKKISIEDSSREWYLLESKTSLKSCGLIFIFDPHYLKTVCLTNDLPSKKPKDERWLCLPFSDSEVLDNIYDKIKKEPLWMETDVSPWMSDLKQLLPILGLSLEKSPNNKPAKARHKWTKEIKYIPFNVTYRGSSATVYWQKRQEMCIVAGAKLVQEAPLNKDGSVGFAAKVGDKLRLEQADKIQNGYTIEDVILKSVNEVGLFLYYGGTNGWQVLVDSEGKSIDEWTRAG
ncbi:hypothetical protein M2909_06170 [Vagococcus lutrae]|uniref:hypothetical protein n=1 Tax=Vagococcus lutrae TaxID=81947 RepID=UPI00200ECE17|nr:hypothetical protein [Vagococcus lutrae]MDT2816715.1 hypothetical protein [Vagococcus lutrae]UQF22729.1 hypothetical protein M2909_06170 [Vagococcus lutrae]UQF63351.1 hypothetical protein M2908_05545 [Vagococcus lutrae]